MAVRRADTCYTCRFWIGHGVRERGPKGDCYRFPPVPTDRAPAGSRPITLLTDWCGEWQRHAGDRDAEPMAAETAGKTLYDEL
jgi:hypothetical protein